MVERILFSPGGASEATLAALLTELQAKLEAGQTVVVSQGAPGASAWPVDISGATVTVGNLQQLSVITSLSVAAHDLAAAAYSGTAVFANDSLLGVLALRFSTAQARDVTLTRNDGTVLLSLVGDTSLRLDIDFEDAEVDAGTTLTLAVTQTAGACQLNGTLTSKVGTAALGGNPVLGESHDHIGEVGIDVIDSPAGDAFGRLRISQPLALLDSVHQYNASPLQWGSITAAGGSVTHQPFASAVRLDTTTAAGSSVKFQTRRYLRYQPGKSLLILASMVLGAAEAGVRRRVGYFDDANGIFLQQTVAGLSVVRRSSTSGTPVDTEVAQADWNLDKLDGTGISGLTIDPTKTQLLVIDLQWLSVGRVRVGFDVNGRIYYFHQFINANVLTLPYMGTANLPVRYEQANTGGAAASSLLAICASVVSEGGRESLGYVRSANTGRTGHSVGATKAPILAIRPALTIGGLANRGVVMPLGVDLLSSGDILWEIVHMPALTGGSWSAVGADSMVEHDAGTSTGYTGGEVVASGYKGTGSGVVSAGIDLERVVLSLDPAGATADTLALVAQSITGSATVYGSLQWREEY